jgi:hypothetical protein
MGGSDHATRGMATHPIVANQTSAVSGRDARSWAIAQASRHPRAPRTGRVLSRKALVRGVTPLPPEPVPDADASHPLNASAPSRRPRRQKRKSATDGATPAGTSAASPTQSCGPIPPRRQRRSSAASAWQPGFPRNRRPARDSRDACRGVRAGALRSPAPPESGRVPRQT